MKALPHKGSTVFLRATIVTLGLLVLLGCFFLLPAIYREWGIEYPHLAAYKWPVLIGITTTAIAFFAALWQGLKLLGYIDNNKAFSKRSITALRKIKTSAVIIGTVYAIALPLIYQVANSEDAPGLMVIGLIFTGAPIVVAVFAATVQSLLQNAIDLKNENDLTV